MKTLLIATALVSSTLCQASTFVCTRDMRGVDGSMAQLALIESQPGKYQIELSWKAGGLCPQGPCRGEGSAVVAKDLSCSFNTTGLPLIDCSKESEGGNSYFRMANITTTQLNQYTHEVEQLQTVSTSVGSPEALTLEQKPLKSLLNRTWDSKNCKFVE